jgi:hypothetical protein
MSIRRIRYIKPEFPEDTELATVSRDARLFFASLWCYTDMNGLTEDNVRWLKKTIFPYDQDITLERVDAIVSELIGIKKLVPVEWSGKRYLYIPKFSKHQKFHRGEQPHYRVPEEIIRKSLQHPAGMVPAPFNDPANSIGIGIGIGTGTGIGIGIGTGMGTGEGEPAGEEADEAAIARAQEKLVQLRRRGGLNDDGTNRGKGLVQA